MEMTCENDQGDGDEDTSSDDYDEDIFAMEADGCADDAASTDSLSQWQKLTAHGGEDSSYFDGE
jgi:hypothetical protein